MRLIIKRKDLKDAVAGFNKVVAGKSSLPILEGVRFSVDGNSVVAQVTDLDQALEYRFDDAYAEGTGACIIPLSALKPLAKGAGTETVEICDEKPGTITIINHIGDHAVSQPVTGMDIDDWPDIDTDVVTAPTDRFVENYRRLIAFSSTDETRYVLNSVFAEIGKGRKAASMVATDGRRLACFNHMELPFKRSVILPKTKFLAWTKLPVEVDVGLRDNDGTTWLGVKAGPFTYVAKCPEGTYPNFRQAIPAESGENVITFADADADLLKQVLKTFPGDDVVTIVGQDGQITFYGRGADDSGWSTLTLEHSTYTGECRFVGLDRGYLLDALGVGFREFAFNDELSPLLSDDGKGGIHVLMPMRVSDPDPCEAADNADESVVTEPDANTPVTQPNQQPKPSVSTEDAPAVKQDKEHVMPNHNTTTQSQSDVSQIELAIQAVDAVKAQVQEVGSSLKELTAALKQALRDDKSQRKEMESARVALAKLQAISL
jgi:DNA polymerase III sliding clamp (beta) subunit (PCNA family)